VWPLKQTVDLSSDLVDVLLLVQNRRIVELEEEIALPSEECTVTRLIKGQWNTFDCPIFTNVVQVLILQSALSNHVTKVVSTLKLKSLMLSSK
jgi:hypothetical protein